MIFFQALAVTCALVWPHAQNANSTPTPSDLGHRVPLAPAYSGEAIETPDYGIVGAPFRYRFSVAQDWTVGTKLIIDPDFGDTPLAYEHATNDESWVYEFGQSPRAIRDDRFATTGRGAIEIFISPMPIVRELRSGRLNEQNWSVATEGDSTVLDIRRSGVSVVDRLIFDRATGHLTHHQLVSFENEVRMDWAFENWIPVGVNGEAPTRVITHSFPPGDGSERGSTTVLTNLQSIDSTVPPERLMPRSDATIIDRIEGVTRRADGTSLGALAPTDGQASPVVASRAQSSTNTRALMVIGIVLILLAGAVLGWRRWKSV